MGEIRQVLKKKKKILFVFKGYNCRFKREGVASFASIALRPCLWMMAIGILKVLHKRSPAYLNDIVSFKHISYSFRPQQTVEIPQMRTATFGLNSLRYAGATLWNELPDAIRFKSLINNWNGNSRRCGSCRS